MYICDICGAVFDAPARREERTVEDGRVQTLREDLCPVCATPLGSVWELAADTCPRCGGYKYRPDLLCPACRRDLAARFRAFADDLTAEEETQLDAWLDGASVTDRGKFN